LGITRKAKTYWKNMTRSHSLALVSLFAALMAVLGLIPKIDLAFGVPITLQTLGVMLAGCLLGPRLAFQALVLFLTAVAIGLPLLSGGRGGFGVFLTPSAGYLLAWPVGALVTGWIMRAIPTDTPPRVAISAFIASLVGGLVVIHASGVVGLINIAGMTLTQALIATSTFVPGDIVKCVLCALVCHTVARGLPDWKFANSKA
jgi:biotin transport system substrate-specific component